MWSLLSLCLTRSILIIQVDDIWYSRFACIHNLLGICWNFFLFFFLFFFLSSLFFSFLLFLKHLTSVMNVIFSLHYQKNYISWLEQPFMYITVLKLWFSLCWQIAMTNFCEIILWSILIRRRLWTSANPHLVFCLDQYCR